MYPYNHLVEKKEKQWLAYASLTSLAFHVMLTALLATTRIFYPVTGTTEHFDILWVFPHAMSEAPPSPRGSERKPPVDSTSPRQVTTNTLSIQTKPAPVATEHTVSTHSTITRPAPPSQPTTLKQPVIQQSVPPSVPATNEQPDPGIVTSADDTALETAMLLPAGPASRVKNAVVKKKPAAVKPSIPAPVVRTAPLSSHEAGTGEQATEIHPIDKTSRTVTPPVVIPPIPSVIAPSVKIAAAPLQPDIVQSHELAAMNQAFPETVPLSSPPPALPTPAVTRTQSPPPPTTPVTTSANTAPAKGGASLQATRPQPHANIPVEAKKTVKTNNTASHETKGIFAPPLVGNLKLELRSTTAPLDKIKIAVTFLEYPESRRTRPLTKSEAQSVQTVTPKMARTRADTLQVAIESVREGIYTFRLISPTKPTIDSHVRLILYEKSPKAKSRPLEQHTFTNNSIIGRILMPEGILWSDESAFTGSIEDSDSVTKFNSDTGLVWKEYK